jgi:hypothetical protein
MRPTLVWVAIAGVAALAGPSAAGVAGAWRVDGTVPPIRFTLDCDFKPDGPTFSGVCVDVASSDPRVAAGKSHPLTAGSVNLDKVSWTYQASFLLARFPVVYRGTRTGNQISGSIDVAGRTGTFTATRH